MSQVCKMFIGFRVKINGPDYADITLINPHFLEIIFDHYGFTQLKITEDQDNRNIMYGLETKQVDRVNDLFCCKQIINSSNIIHVKTVKIHPIKSPKIKKKLDQGQSSIRETGINYCPQIGFEIARPLRNQLRF